VTAVRPLRRRERAAALDVLVAALADGPDWVRVLPDERLRRFALRRLLAVAVADAGPHARVAERDGRVVGVAVWQPPGRYPMSARRQLRAAPRLVPVLLRLGPRFAELRRMGEAVDAAFPTDPVLYLQVLGVAPALQRRGVGAALLAAGLRAADSDGVDAYLETAGEANVAYYRGHGFELVEPGRPLHDGGAVMWRMRRPAARRPGGRPAPA
jgi:ribosomal protein S18 acetylase RimI-like enzyme